jgi:hypothetical protein
VEVLSVLAVLVWWVLAEIGRGMMGEECILGVGAIDANSLSLSGVFAEVFDVA